MNHGEHGWLAPGVWRRGNQPRRIFRELSPLASVDHFRRYSPVRAGADGFWPEENSPGILGTEPADWRQAWDRLRVRSSRFFDG